MPNKKAHPPKGRAEAVLPPYFPVLVPKDRRTRTSISPGGGTEVYVVPVPWAFNDAQPSQPSSVWTDGPKPLFSLKLRGPFALLLPAPART